MSLCVLGMQDKLHGGSMRWWVWVEDPVLNRLHHAEAWTLTKKVRPWLASTATCASTPHTTLLVAGCFCSKSKTETFSLSRRKLVCCHCCCAVLCCVVACVDAAAAVASRR